jgi:hypothetical protein
LGTGLGEDRWLSVVGGFLLGRWDESDLAVQAAVVPPVEVFEHGELQLLDGPPGTVPFDQLGLDLADRRLGEGVDAPIVVKPLLVGL